LRLTAALTSAGPFGILLLLLPLLVGCGMVPRCCPDANGATAAEGPLQVAVSVPPQAYFVRRIGGPHVHVEVMIPPGYSHVDYPLTPRKMVVLSNADLYVKVGHPGFEFEATQIDPFLAQLPAVRVVDMSRDMRFLDTASAEGNGHGDLEPEDGDHHGHEHGGSDPHVWVAPDTVAVAAVNIAAGLAAADPAHAGEYRANLRRFLADIHQLDAEIRARLGAHPPGESRAFLVYHPTWGYFADQYGLTQIAIESEGREPSAARLITLIERARKEGVRVIFVQEGFPRKSAQVIAEAVGAQVVTADPQRYDWLDNLREVSTAMNEAFPHGRPGHG
jgi:zinc transport system substrate-binding protein